MRQLLIASHNAKKIEEFRALLTPLQIETVAASDYRLIEPAETGATFEENAAIKALAAAQATGLPALSDDSGLCVPALDGAPGVYSADWAGHPRDFNRAMQRLQDELQHQPDRRAYFVCVLALAVGKQCQFFRGEVWGNLIWPPRGDHGFGYDPMFVPDGFKDSFAQMPAELKNRLSHRAKALDKLLLHLQT